MSGVTNSIGGFLGTSKGPQAQATQTGNISGNELNDENSIFSSQNATDLLQNAAQSGNVQGAINQIPNEAGALDSTQQQGLANALATGATTGSQYATQQVQSNPLLSQGLNQIQGQLQIGQGEQAQQTGILNGLQSQGFNLTPGDQSLYGQEAGQIANQYAQQGNQAANSLASRGLSSSGAAGAQFSGIAGNQNQQLAQAQQQIAQQRFSNTQNQIAQQQNFIGSLNSQNNQAANNYSNQASSDIQQQYGRQLQGAQAQQGDLATASGQQQQANSAANQSNLAGATFNAANTPTNFMDALTGGAALGGGSAANKQASGLFGSAGGATSGASSGAGAAALA